MTDQKHMKEQCVSIKLEDLNALHDEIASLKNDVFNQVYQGNSIGYIHQKMVNYGNQLSALRRQRNELREALEKIQSSIPAHMNGDFIIEHFDSEGNYAGTEQINPVSIIGGIVDIVDDALTETKESV